MERLNLGLLQCAAVRLVGKWVIPLCVVVGFGWSDSTSALHGLGGTTGSTTSAITGSPILGTAAIATGAMIGNGTGTGTGASGGYHVSGNWKGYAFTAAEGISSTINPANYSAHLTGQPYCASGTVGPSADFGGFALVGFNLNQLAAAGSPLLTYMPTGTGINYSISNTGQSPLRIQLQGVGGSRWCVDITASSGSLPWSAFSVDCFLPTPGAPYDGNQPLVSVQFIVPGTNTNARPFNFCVNSLSEAGDEIFQSSFEAGETAASAQQVRN